MEQEVGQGDTEVTGELTTVSSSNNTNPFFEEVGKNPFLEDDKNPFHNNNDDDDDDDDDKNPFKESKSTNPFDEDEGKSGPKQKLIKYQIVTAFFLTISFIYGVFNCLIFSEPLASSSPGSSSSKLVKVYRVLLFMIRLTS